MYIILNRDEITLVMGRNDNFTYKDKKMYSHDQLLTLHQLFTNNVIAYILKIYKEYALALNYFNANKIYNYATYKFILKAKVYTLKK